MASNYTSSEIELFYTDIVGGTITFLDIFWALFRFLIRNHGANCCDVTAGIGLRSNSILEQRRKGNQYSSSDWC